MVRVSKTGQVKVMGRTEHGSHVGKDRAMEGFGQKLVLGLGTDKESMRGFEELMKWSA